jgi:hypothetical protein
MNAPHAIDILSIEFESQNCNGWPKLRFAIDGETCFQHEIHTQRQKIDITCSTDPGRHVLQIERYGKTFDNTVFVDGKILQDQMIVLADIYLNNIRLPDFIKYGGTFSYGTVQNLGDLWWGHNGIWHLDFQTPLIDWIIDKKRSNDTKVADLFDYQNRLQLLHDLNDFKKELDKHGCI